MRKLGPGTFISFLAAIAAIQIAAAAAPQDPNAPIPNAGVTAPAPAMANSAHGTAAQWEYLRNMSIHVGVLDGTSMQSLDSLCPRRHIGINSAALDNYVLCNPF